MRDAHTIIQRPHLTEKGTVLSDVANQYLFEVAPDANKIEVKRAVEKLFNVKVLAVNTMVRKGKQKGQRGRLWNRPDVKRALVTLAEGQKIEFV